MSQAQMITQAAILDEAAAQLRYARVLVKSAYVEEDKDIRLCVLDEAEKSLDNAIRDLQAAGAQ